EAACAEHKPAPVARAVVLSETIGSGVTTGALSSERRSTRRTRSAIAMAVSFAIGALGFGVATAASRRGAAPAAEAAVVTGVAQVAATTAVGVEGGAEAVAIVEPKPTAVEAPAVEAPAVEAAIAPKASSRGPAPKAAGKKASPGADPARSGELGGVGASLQSLEAAVKSEGQIASAHAAQGKGAKDAAHSRKEKAGEEVDQRRPAADRSREAPRNLNWLNERL
ncbi:MAG TPA: hypothetical protein VFS00_21020, partial [Polyangiaceae bacterium]|nr:hypothetical protein [Polyangiaceae bacterium]